MFTQLSPEKCVNSGLHQICILNKKELAICVRYSAAVCYCTAAVHMQTRSHSVSQILQRILISIKRRGLWGLLVWILLTWLDALGTLLSNVWTTRELFWWIRTFSLSALPIKWQHWVNTKITRVANFHSQELYIPVVSVDWKYEVSGDWSDGTCLDQISFT